MVIVYGMAVQKTKRPRRGGRVSKGKFILAYDLGGTKLASGVVTQTGKVLAHRSDALDLTGGPAGFLAFLSRTGDAWRKRFPAIGMLGIASAGPLDVARGVLLQPTNFPRWGNVAVAGPLRRTLGIPVAMHNDAAAAAAAEGWLGGATRLRNWMVLTLGTGLGTGVVMGRRVFMGGSGLGPEAGHMIITDRPYPCGCGNTGCAEAALSGTALARRIAERADRWWKAGLPPPKDTRELVARAREKDAEALAIFAEFSELLARAIHNYAVLFQPEKVFFAGGLAEASDLFLSATRHQVTRMLSGRPGFEPRLGLSELGKESGVLAGAWVARFRMKKN